MSLSCTICQDVIIPTADCSVTNCGHVFHEPCLGRWLESAKTCPQCRSNTSNSKVHRLFLNFVASDHSADDPATLQAKISTLEYQMKMKDMDVKTKHEKYYKQKLRISGLKLEVKTLEAERSKHIAAIYALKDEVQEYEEKAAEKKSLEDEVARLRGQIRSMQNVEAVIHGTVSEVEQIVQNESNFNSLAILTVTLKRTLLETDRKRNITEHKTKQLQTELMKYKKENAKLETINKELQLQLDTVKETWESEKTVLTSTISKLQEKKTVDKYSNNIERILTESPMPLPRKSSGEIGDISMFDSPSVEDQVKKIVSSDSPYLQVKSSSMGIDFTKVPRTHKTGFYKTPVKQVENIKFSVQNNQLMYNGLGGTSKEDIFPSPKTARPITGIKRHKPASSLSSTKFRKLTNFNKPL